MGRWLKNLSILAVLGFPLAVIGTRMNLWQYGVGLRIVAATFVLACLVLAVSLAVAAWQRSTAPAAKRAALTAALISLLPVIGIGSQLVLGSRVPAIHNISTDVADPPRFDRIASIRTSEHNPHSYDSSALAALQQAAYPNIATHYTTMTQQDAHRRALATARQLGWDIVHEDSSAGVIEASETTRLWNFTDDVVIRIRQQDGRTAVDLRSVSRVGRSDLGANAKRIERFLRAFEK